MSTPESISLRNTEGSSNKVYNVHLEAKDGGWVVNYANGKFGGTLATGTKTPVPLDYDAAKKTFDKLIKSKIGGGYRVEGDATAYITVTDRKLTGINVQLLNPIGDAELADKINDPAWMAQEKHFGDRKAIRVKNGEVEGSNKKGMLSGLPKPIADSALTLNLDLVIDGEEVGDTLYAFDLLEVGSMDLRDKPALARWHALQGLLRAHALSNIVLVETAMTAIAKQEMLERLQAEGKEGMVFKKKEAPYVAGRPSSGGNQLKYKFYKTASVVVAEVNQQRSVAMKVLDGDKWVAVGNVTIPSNHPVPAEGAIIEVRYLHAYERGSLYEPTYLGERNDVDADECVISQLQYKAA